MLFLHAFVCSHPLYLVGDGDLKEGSEVSQPCTKAVPEDGQLEQEDVKRPFLCGNRKQLTVIRPAQLIQTWRRTDEEVADVLEMAI